MDARVFKLAAQFKVRCKTHGFDFEIVRFIDDPEYARQVLGNLDQLDDGDTIELGLLLRQELGLVAPQAPAAPQTPQPAAAPEGDGSKYRFGARG